MRYCAPDLPFLDTVLWYMKQMGAVLLIMGVLGAVYFGCALLSSKGKP